MRVMQIEDIALTFIPRLGVRGAVHLLDIFGSAAAIFAAGADALMQRASLNEDIARRIASREGFREAERELTYCSRYGIRPIASTDADYPQMMLRGTSDYPHVIYTQGDVTVLNRRTLSIVGTRRCSAMSDSMCMRIVGGLAERIPDLTVVSGLAFGVDAQAHRAAVACGVPTVAVIPEVLPGVQPSSHRALADDILAHGGVLLSELNSSARSNPSLHIIPRNRIVAAMGEGLLVVESPLKGGSIITAGMADSYNRTVMALPGRPTDIRSEGCNALIRRNMALLVCTADDIIDSLNWQASGPKNAPADNAALLPPLSDDEMRIAEVLAGGEALDPDSIASRAAMDIGTALSTLMMMELSGTVRALPGNLYELLRQ